MNRELLTKLYSDAVEYCVAQPPNADGTSKAWLWEEKFAELIVLQCGVALNHNYPPDDLLPINEVMHCLKEHFGVEE
jgi:hypothetical protein